MFRKKTVAELLQSLSNEQFTRLVNEVALATHWHNVGWDKAIDCLFTPGCRSDQVYLGFQQHGKIRKQIPESGFYLAVRSECVRRNGRIPEGWNCWLGLTEDQVKLIKACISVILTDYYPASGRPPGKGKLALAHTGLTRLGLTGIFVDFHKPTKDVDMEKAFRRMH